MEETSEVFERLTGLVFGGNMGGADRGSQWLDRGRSIRL